MTRTTIALLAVLLGSGSAHAQQAGTTCTYETCALRIRGATFTAPPKLVRGQQDEEIVPLGLLQPAIAPFMVNSDSARFHAARYDVLYDQGTFISLFGTGMAIVAPIIFDNTSQKIGFTIAGIGIGMIGGVIVNQAHDALSRAVWWYNRELVR